jgi:diacylglycerol kinase family enzyme
LPTDPWSLAAALASGRSRTRWPGFAPGADGGRLFVQMLGVGLDAQVVHRLPLPLKRALGRGAHVAQTAREALRRAPGPLTVRLDGTETEAAAVVVSKGRFYAGPYLLAPDATPGEPGFAVALFDRTGPLAAMRYAAALPLNRLPRQPGLRLMRARLIEITGRGGVPAQADGDPAGTVPVSVADAAEPINIVVG